MIPILRLQIVLLMAAVSGFSSVAAADSAAAYVVVDDATGHVLRASGENRKLQIGSLTKVATAMVVLDWLQLTRANVDQMVTVPGGALPVMAAGNPINLQPGDRVSIRDLLYAALMQSDNVAAFTLADHIGKNVGGPSNVQPVDRFAAQMNALARKLTMRSTLFVNPHGLDANERKLPYSTALDLARLTRYAEERSQFRFYVSQKDRQITIQGADGDARQYLLQNTNELLGVEDIDGVKTGKTSRAGECVILSAAHSPESRQEGDKYFITPRRLIVVVLGSDARFRLGLSLMQTGWQAYDAWSAAGKPMTKGGD